jgi:hypothetical protein
MSAYQKFKAYMFIQDYKQRKHLEELHKSSLIEMNDYFKYSGKTEKTSKIVSDFVYFHNNLADKLAEVKLKNKKNGR